jgi:NAD(P)H-dependent flavin oxidoreductase YrpB (nitropropane dioxygenase family)
MMWVGRPELVAAISNAGGLGMLTALIWPKAEDLREAIAQTRALTDKPFGVNLTLLPLGRAPDYPALRRVIVESGVRIVETAGHSPHEHIAALKEHGVTVIHKCTSVRHALSAQKMGADIVTIDGFECAGHPGEDDVGGIVLIPAAVDALSIPVLGCGGFADGRGLAAALALGAQGITMGTRFCATVEAPIHDRVKQVILANDERDTRLILRGFKNTGRVALTSVSAKVVELSARADVDFEMLRPYVAGEHGRRALETGDIEQGLVWAGQSQGLIHDIPTCADLIARIMAQAEAVMAKTAAMIAA